MALSAADKQRAYRERKRAAAEPEKLASPSEQPLESAVSSPDEPQLDTSLSSLLDVVFIDWLSIYQVYRPGTVPVIGSEFIVSTSLETGEIVSQSVTGFQHEGSFDTRIHVRCDGEAIFVSGNPSAYNRMDNLFGVRSMVEAVKVYNAVLRLLGLPEFTLPGEHQVPPNSSAWVRWDPDPKQLAQGFSGFLSGGGRQSAFYDTLLADGRPRITAVHLTVNLATSDPVGFIRQMSAYVYKGKPGFLYPNGRSVDWPIAKGLQREYSRRVYHKYYDKVYELECKLAGLHVQKKRDPLNLVLRTRINYLQKLLAWARPHGIVRREVGLKSTDIISRGLIHIENWSLERMANVIYPYQFHNKLKTENTRLDNIYDDLIALEYSHAISSKASMLHRSWINGDDVRQLAGSRQTFDRYRNILLSFGVDIAQPCNISRLTLRAERFTWSHLQPPDWYLQPGHSVELDSAASFE